MSLLIFFVLLIAEAYLPLQTPFKFSSPDTDIFATKSNTHNEHLAWKSYFVHKTQQSKYDDDDNNQPKSNSNKEKETNSTSCIIIDSLRRNIQVTILETTAKCP